MRSAPKPYGEKTEAQKEAIRETSRRYYWEHREERLQYQRESNPAHKREALRKSRAKLKAEVYSHYGSVCTCCGETNAGFLSIDHVKGGGFKHRQAVGGGLAILYDIKRRGYPRGEFQILCFNCNLGRQLNGGICPHKE
jgi:hypothetical protein